MKEIDASTVAGLLKDAASPPTLLDVRESWEWDLARVDGAVHMPMGNVPDRVGELDPSKPVVVMCHHGGRSRQVAIWLKSRGFADVSNFDGGIDAWSREIDPTVPRY
jgi:rhodanese-related sulfurtransferase